MHNTFVLDKKKVKPMDVLWGDWLENIVEVENDDNSVSLDFQGIYHEIKKQNKDDFPIITDLFVVLSLQAKLVEAERTYDMDLKILDLDGSPIYSSEDIVTVPMLDGLGSVVRWYEFYEFTSVMIREPGYYELSVLINREVKQIVPLEVFAPKMTWFHSDGSTTEMWLEDWFKKRRGE